MNAASLNAPERSKNFRRRDLRNRPGAQFGKDEALELTYLTRQCAGAQTWLLESEPFARNRLEGIPGRILLRAALHARVNSLGQQPARFAPFARPLERDIWIRAEREQLLNAGMSIPETPQP